MAVGCGGANNPMYSARPEEAVACGICRKDLGLVLSLLRDSLPGPPEYGSSVSSQRLRFEYLSLCLWHSWEVAEPLGRRSSGTACALEEDPRTWAPIPPNPPSHSLLPGCHDVNIFALPCPPVKKICLNAKQKSQCYCNMQSELNRHRPPI